MYSLACSVGRSVVLPECLTAVCNVIYWKLKYFVVNI